MKKTLLLITMIIMMMALAACRGRQEDESVITFAWWGTSDRNIATYQAIALFEDTYPQYKVEGEQSPWTGYQTTLNNRLSRGREADIFQVNYNWIYSMLGDLYFLDLNLLDLDFSKYPDNEHAPLTVDGKVLGLSVSETGYIFYLNKAVYEAAGVMDIPQTWDDLIAAGVQIGAHNPGKYALGRLDAQQAAILMFTYLSQQTGKNVINQDNQLNFTQQELQLGFSFLNTLRNNNVLIPSNATDTHNDGPTNPNWQIYQNYGGIMTWNTAISEYQNTLPDAAANMVAAGMFQQEEGDKLGMYKKVSMAYAVSKRVEQSEAKMQAVRTFLEFMTTDPGAVAILGVDRGVSNHVDAQSILLNHAEKDFTQTLEWQGHLVVQNYYNHQLTLGQDLYIHPYYEHDTFRRVYETPIERFLLGTYTASQAINDIMNRFNSELANVMRG